jgi:hypothetical protein
MLNTIEEWQDYIGKLAGGSLRSKVLAANTQPFVRMMRDEGFDIDFIESILLAFVRQLVLTDQIVPDDDGAFDLVDMADTDPVCAKTIPMSPDQIQRLIDNPPDEPPDAVDLMAAEADESDLDDEWGETLV